MVYFGKKNFDPTYIISMEFGERLKDLRKKSGLTQVELARKAGVTQTLVTYYETGARKPKLEKAILLAKALNVAVEHFFDSKKPIKEKIICLSFVLMTPLRTV